MSKVSRKKVGGAVRKAPPKKEAKPQPRPEPKPRKKKAQSVIEAPEKETRPTKILSDGRLDPRGIQAGDRVLVIPHVIDGMDVDYKSVKVQPKSFLGTVHSFVTGKDKGKGVIGVDVFKIGGTGSGSLNLALWSELYPASYTPIVTETDARRAAKTVPLAVGVKYVRAKGFKGDKPSIPFGKPFTLADVAAAITKIGKSANPNRRAQHIVSTLLREDKIIPVSKKEDE